MKNKFVILTLCFTIIFTNINLNNYKSYANNSVSPLVVDGGIISAPMLATVSSLAVGSGIVLKNSDDVYDIGRIFYDYINNKNDITWDFVQSTFLTSCVLVNDVIHVKSDFLNIVNDFFNTIFSEPVDLGSYSGFPYVGAFHTTRDHNAFRNASVSRGIKIDFSEGLERFSVGNYDFEYNRSTSYGNEYNVLLNGSIITTFTSSKTCYFVSYRRLFDDGSVGDPTIAYTYPVGVSGSTFNNCKWATLVGGYDFPYSGGYDWDKVKDRENEGTVALPIPGNLDSLVGQGSDSFWDNTDNLVGGGSITLPGVDSPSIGVTDDVFIGSPSTDVPGVGNPSIPNDSIWSTIKDFVVSLVVPSDTFWTDTFNGFRENFSKNFPMLDMSKFDSLAVGGKPFPNLYAYGSKIVDGDVINSIVDWLRPIIAGFIMICLMFFNYRKIYKLIRNTEPFGGIAQGTSDFRTGLSAPPINNGLDSNPMGNLRDTLFDMRNEILRRENSK